MRHHTKDKGDSGLGFVIADLLANGVQVALPISEHLPFDCIAIAEDGKLCRLSVKYRKKDKKGKIEVRHRSIWSDSNGTHFAKHDKTEYDASAVFCPDTQRCYYITNEETASGFTMRIDKPQNGQTKGIRFAEDYKDPKRLF